MATTYVQTKKEGKDTPRSPERRIIDLRDPDDCISWKKHIELEQQATQWHKRSEAAQRGWVTRRKNSNPQ